jgi:hypothetical protein
MRKMDDILQKIDSIRERTGASYKEAKEVLEQADGDILEAIIIMEEKKNKDTWTEQFNVAGSEVVEKLKEIVRTGNVNRIKVKKGEYMILDIPITAGAVGAVFMPYITAIGAAVAFVSKCTIEIERPYKSDININEEVADMVKMAEQKAKEQFDKNEE